MLSPSWPYRLQGSQIGFGAWATGGSCGPVDDAESLAALRAAPPRICPRYRMGRSGVRKIYHARIRSTVHQRW
ncbi:MAG TPA: hypothetical protein VNY05_03115 [Candidatus Acidoferrales bacterium]|nr:hypothetical protein [Candidatus Acidoferrales bacterium]